MVDRFMYLNESKKGRTIFSLIISFLMTLVSVFINISALILLKKQNQSLNMEDLIFKNLILGGIIFLIMYIASFFLLKSVFTIEAYPEYLLVKKYHFKRTKFSVLKLKDINLENVVLESSIEKVFVNVSEIKCIKEKEEMYIIITNKREYVVKKDARFNLLKEKIKNN